MPRKKKPASQPLGELLGLGVAQKDKEPILRAINGLPPIAYWARCQTTDQAQHYIQMKAGYQFLKEELQRFFGGQGSLMPHLSESDRNFFGALRDRYIAWYSAIQLGWAYITEELKAVGLTPEEVSMGCPGEALVRILENECAGFMQPAFLPYSRYSPSQDRKLSKVQKLGDAAEAKDKKRYEAQSAQNFAAIGKFFALTEGMIDVCEKHTSNNKPLKKAVRTYRYSVAELDREILYHHSTRAKRKGHEWKNGIKTELSRG